MPERIKEKLDSGVPSSERDTEHNYTGATVAESEQLITEAQQAQEVNK